VNERTVALGSELYG